MPPQESPVDSTTPSLPTPEVPKKRKKKEPKPPKPAPPPPKTTSRGEIVRKATEERLAQEKLTLNRQLEERKLATEKQKAKAPKMEPEESKEPAKPKKVIKKTIPKWASGSHKGRSSEKPRLTEVLFDAFDHIGDTVSAMFIKDHLKAMYPDNFKSIYGMSIKRAVEKGYIKKVRGSYKLLRKPEAGDVGSKKQSLEDILPHVFTWVCDPKEASAIMIKKYFDLYYPALAADPKGFRKALEVGVSKGQLERLTGKGASGTFGLVDGASKTGTRFEDPIEDAIIAMNEPKDASVVALRGYLDSYHAEYGTKARPYLLKQALERLFLKGHLTRVSGKGFSGSLRLSYPYYPSPKDLWGTEDEQEKKEKPKKKPQKIVVKLKKPSAPKAAAATPKGGRVKDLKKKKRPLANGGGGSSAKKSLKKASAKKKK